MSMSIDTNRTKSKSICVSVGRVRVNEKLGKQCSSNVFLNAS